VPLAGKICVSIATTGDVSLLKEQADSAFSLGADFAEIRFDFVSSNRMQAAIDAVKGIRSKAVFTLRSKDQGGKFAGSEQERIEWLKKLAQQKPMLLDVELDTIKENDELADFLEKTPILVSWHDFQQTPPSDELAHILSEMRIYSNYVKVVTTAKSVEDSLRLLELYESTTGLHPVIFAMGDAGIVSRILCTIVGNAPFTYTSLEKAVVPGQLTVKQMRKLYDRIASGT
jgi:3-dehydroquinate dehydratase I